MSRVTRGMRRFGSTTRSVSSLLGGFGGGITAAFGARAGLGVIGEFQEEMSRVLAVTRATSEEFDALNAAARTAGATTRFTAGQAASGLGFLGMAGFAENEAIAALPATLSLASAGSLELGRAADIASNVLAQFNLEAEETTRIADVLANTAASSNTNVEQLSEAFKLAGPIAGAMGRSVEETAAALGVLGNAGIQASLAGTQVRGIFAALLQPTDTAEASFERMGLTLDDLNPRVKSLAEIFGTLRERGFNERDAVAIFGRRQATGALVFSQFAEEIVRLDAANRAATGSAERMALVMEDNLPGALRALKSAVSEAVLQLSDESGFGNALRNTIELTTDAVRILVGMESAVQGNYDAAAKLAGGFKLVGTTLGVLVGLKAASWAIALSGGLLRAAGAALLLDGALAPALVSLAALGAVAGSLAIGAYIADEFRVARESTTEFVGFATEQFARLRAGFELEMAGLGRGVRDAVEAGLSAAFESMDVAGDFAQNVLGNGQLARNLFGLAGAGRAGLRARQGQRSNESAEIASERDRILAEMDARIAEARAVRDAVLADIEKEFANLGGVGTRDRKGRSFVDFIKAELSGVVAEINVFRDAITRTRPELDAAFGDEAGAALSDTINEMNLAMAEFEQRINNVGDGFDDLRDKGGKTLDDLARQQAALASSFEGAFLNGLDEAVVRAGDLRDVLRNVALEFASISLQQSVSNLAGNVGGFFAGLFPGSVFAPPTVESARGNVFNAGNVIPFAAGGIINGPMTFPLRNGIGLAGEAGPEAIVPLQRDSRGNLGVSGGGNVTVNMNITTPDADSFRRSRGQQLRAMQGAAASAFRRG